MSHYVALVEVFKHYASVGSAVSTGEIDTMEASDITEHASKRETNGGVDTDHHATHPIRSLESPNDNVQRLLCYMYVVVGCTLR